MKTGLDANKTITDADLLETLLSLGEVSQRVKQLATEAANAAGHERVLEILRDTKGGHHD